MGDRLTSLHQFDLQLVVLILLGQTFAWLYAIFDPECVGAGLASHGDFETLVAARISFRQTFDRLLMWARGSREGAG